MRKKLKVLMIGDYHPFHSSLPEIVGMAGYDVAGCAASVAEALVLAKRLQPDLAILDVRLCEPEEGFIGAYRMRKWLGLPIIFLAGKIHPEIRNRLASFGSAPFLSRPLHPATLIHIVDRVFKGPAAC